MAQEDLPIYAIPSCYGSLKFVAENWNPSDVIAMAFLDSNEDDFRSLWLADTPSALASEEKWVSEKEVGIALFRLSLQTKGLEEAIMQLRPCEMLIAKTFHEMRSE